MKRMLSVVLAIILLLSAMSCLSVSAADTHSVFLTGTFNDWSTTANPLTGNGSNYTTTIELEEGIYSFKILSDGTWYGNGGTIIDTTSLSSETGWVMDAESGDCTLDATGGTYAFTYDVAKNVLVIDYTPFGAKEDVTIKLAVPKGTYNAYNWTAPALMYSTKASSSTADFTQLPMTATDEVFYASSTGQCTLISTGAWQIYKLTLTPEQQDIINSAQRVGFASDSSYFSRTTITSNVLKAGINGYATYGDLTTLADLDGYTFIITDASYGATSNSSFVGYWASELVTVRAAAVLGRTSYSNWNAVSLFYGNETKLASMSTIPMVNTNERTKVKSVGTSETAIKGRWSIYAVTLNSAQVAEVESANYVGFNKTDADNRTNIVKNVLRAPLDDYSLGYNTNKTTLKAVENRVFVVCDQTDAEVSVTSYMGYWLLNYLEGADETVTIYFAAPVSSTQSYYSWGKTVQLYYSNEPTYTTSKRLDMTFTGEYYLAEDVPGASFINGGQWPIMKLELTAEQMDEIQEAAYLGFIKTDTNIRTKYLTGRNVLRASTTEYSATYGNKVSIDTLDGYIFVIQGVADGFESDSYIGSWVLKGDSAPVETSTTAPTAKPTTAAPTTRPTATVPTTASTQSGQKQYSLVGYIDGALRGCEEDDASVPNVFDKNNQVTVEFTSDSYVFVKTTDNANWYMFESYCTATKGTLYNTSTGAFEKMYVPAGTHTFTLVEKGNDTVELSYKTQQVPTATTASTEAPTEASTQAPTDEIEVTVATDPTESTKETVPPTASTQAPTDEIEVTVSPTNATTAPSATYYLKGDFNDWAEDKVLTKSSTGVYSTTFKISKGIYEFKINDSNGNWYGNYGTIVDTTTTTSSVGWVMETTADNCKLQTSGGTYTFSFTPATNTLVITFVADPTEALTTKPTTKPTTASTSTQATLPPGNNGYERGYSGGIGTGTGKVVAFGIDVSQWQGANLSFTNIATEKSFVILKCGTTGYGADTCFTTYYNNAKAAGLDVGVYYFSYSTTTSGAVSDANDTLSIIGSSRTFEYPIYLDYEYTKLSGSAENSFCLGYMDTIAEAGYLTGIYTGYSWSQSMALSTICAKYESWLAWYYDYTYTSQGGAGSTMSYNYGMYQYGDNVYINGQGNYDGDVCYKDYPSIVKTYGFNGYSPQGGGTVTPSSSSSSGGSTTTPTQATTASQVVYYPACSSSQYTLWAALQSIGESPTTQMFYDIADANGISNYSGTAAQNDQMLTLLKQGKLINPYETTSSGGTSSGGTSSGGTSSGGSTEVPDNVVTDLPAPDFYGSQSYDATYNPYSKAYLYGQCTWYSWGRAHEVNGKGFVFTDNAQNWYSRAASEGYSVGTTPRANSIAVWSSGAYGHVAFVEAVDGNNITITESNFYTTTYYNVYSLAEGLNYYDGYNTFTKTEFATRAGTLIGYIYL